MDTDHPNCSAVLWNTSHTNRKALHSSLIEFLLRIIVTIHMVSAMARKACPWSPPCSYCTLSVVSGSSLDLKWTQINDGKSGFAQLLANETHLGLFLLLFVLRGWCYLKSLRQKWLTLQFTFEDRYWMTFQCCHAHIRRGLMRRTHLLTYRDYTYNSTCKGLCSWPASLGTLIFQQNFPCF